MQKTILSVCVNLSMLVLVGCGGGGSGGGSAPPTGSKSGVLTDAPVAGVSYTTSPSGLSGTTDANGVFTYNAGDTVQFKLGALVLGDATASSLVTPLELANGNSDKLINLLVILQSLDADGNPDNGISIPPAAAAAVTSALDLSVAPAALNSAALQAAMSAGGITAPIVSTEAASAHFLGQGMKMFSDNLWVSRHAGKMSLLRVMPDGRYIFGTVRSATEQGVESGVAGLQSFDTRGFRRSLTISVNTLGDVGTSGDPCFRLRFAGDQLLFSEATTTDSGVTCTGDTVFDTFSKAENVPGGIVGVWTSGSSGIGERHVAFFSDGKVFAVRDSVANASCGQPGVETGSYTYNAATNNLVITAITDTSGCDGIFDGTGAGETQSGPFTINADGTATVGSGQSPPLYRVSK